MHGGSFFRKSNMKLNEIQDYKGLGSIQCSEDEDGKKIYLITNYFFNETYDVESLKAAREMLTWEAEQAHKVREAINTLRIKGYKVYKEIA